MYPRAEQTLSLLDVAEHWQRVMPARVDKWVVREVLHRAWWQGAFEVGDPSESLRRKALMIMRELPPEEQRGIVFYEHEDELPPETIWHGDEVEVVDDPWRVRLPADPARWTEAEITEACNTLAKVPPEKLPRLIQGPLIGGSDRSRRVCGLVRSDGMGTTRLLVR